MKRKLSILLITLLVLTLFTACGGNSSADTSADNTTADAQIEEAEAEPAEEVAEPETEAETEEPVPEEESVPKEEITAKEEPASEAAPAVVNSNPYCNGIFGYNGVALPQEEVQSFEYFLTPDTGVVGDYVYEATEDTLYIVTQGFAKTDEASDKFEDPTSYYHVELREYDQGFTTKIDEFMGDMGGIEGGLEFPVNKGKQYTVLIYIDGGNTSDNSLSVHGHVYPALNVEY